MAFIRILFYSIPDINLMSSINTFSVLFKFELLRPVEQSNVEVKKHNSNPLLK